MNKLLKENIFSALVAAQAILGFTALALVFVFDLRRLIYVYAFMLMFKWVVLILVISGCFKDRNKWLVALSALLYVAFYCTKYLIAFSVPAN